MNALLSEVCKEMQVSFSYRDKFVNPRQDIWEETNRAEVVVGLGRSAIEGLASGCGVVAADHRPYQAAMSDGVVTRSTHDMLSAYNFSGRYSRTKITPEILRIQIEYALQKNDSRYLALMHHDIRDKADKYLNYLEA